VLIAAIEAAAKAKGAVPSRADVLSALKGIKFQGVAYVKPVEWSAKGDNLAAVIFVNKVEGDRFQEIDQIGQ
jgi:branched-chain amino acid transport system substrate-binding protein